MTLPEKLMQLRGEQNLSQTALAEALGVSRQTVSKWEAGIAVPTTDNLLRLSKLYGTDLWTLTGVGGRPEGEPSEEKVDEPPAEPNPAEEPADGLPVEPEGRADQAPKRRRVHPAALAAGLCAAFLAAFLQSHLFPLLPELSLYFFRIVLINTHFNNLRPIFL